MLFERKGLGVAKSMREGDSIDLNIVYLKEKDWVFHKASVGGYCWL